MTEDVCEGCGAPLQSDDVNAPGFVPAHIARRGDAALCRRCYRINHYGKIDDGPAVERESVRRTAFDVAAKTEACVMVVDVIDFEGSFLPELAQAAQGRLIVAVNKVDLLPSKTPIEEVSAWTQQRLNALGVSAVGVFPMSARTGFGVRVLFDAARRQAGKHGSVGLIGATNVGKSTLLARWLKGEGEAPTVSPFPGTTMGVIEREIGSARVDILDTPGIVTRGRVTDALCAGCAAQFVPTAPLSSKLLRLSAGSGLLFGGLAAIAPVDGGDAERIVLAFAARNVPISKVKAANIAKRLGSGLAASGEALCAKCRDAAQRSGWEQALVDVGEMEDLVIHGLGWVSPRRSGFTARVTVPAGATVTVRPRLIGPKAPLANAAQH